MTFPDAVLRHFGFLRDEFGFDYRTTHPIGADYPRFQKRGIAIDFFSGKNEIQILICALVDTSILRPGFTKSFSLQAVAMHHNPNAFQGAPSEFDIDTDEKQEAYLAFCANAMKQHCFSVLGGAL